MSRDDPFHLGVKEVLENIVIALTPSNFWVNVFPAMIYLPDWLPGTNWKRTGRRWGEKKDYWVDRTYTQSRSRVVAGEDHDSIVALMLRQAESLGLKSDAADEYIKDAAFALLGGGTDTTATTLLVFFLAMVLFPDIQQRAQAEIDAVVGIDRLPTMKDRPQLGYINRLIE
ncbi:hypothetical protein FRC12_025218 [Ceratobasidium sp. 428]|nr:hypothetical protein FRC12_025218 [Ceratobasidium sp. 428]